MDHLLLRTIIGAIEVSTKPGQLQASAQGVAIRRTNLEYDARGKMRRALDDLGFMDELRTGYSGLGAADTTFSRASADLTQSSGNIVGTTRETFGYDALGNILSSTTQTDVKYASTSDNTASTETATNSYQPGTGRLTISTSGGQVTYRYDRAGNTEFAQGTPDPYIWRGDRFTYYGADNLVRAADRRTIGPTSTSGYKAVFEEYRYDALGRRVLVRSRRKCQNINDDIGGSECQVGMVRRTIWDGTREFYEIQMPDSTTLPGWFENDTLFVPAPVITSPGRWDTNPFFGRVAYTYGLAIDKPISVVRMGYADSSAFFGNAAAPRRQLPPFAFYPSWTVRGQADRFFYSDGDTEKCETISGTVRCVRGYLPAGWFAYKRTSTTPGGWLGTLLEDKRDQAGTYYRRARAYDPTSGRFTQEDPIGLAGGLNLYGFAGGDPVNFSDPFGLYIEPIKDARVRAVLAKMLESPTFKKIWLAMALAPKNEATYSFDVTDFEGVMRFSGGQSGAGHTVCGFRRCGVMINADNISVTVLTDEFVHAAAGANLKTAAKAGVPAACAYHGPNYAAAGCGDIRTKIEGETEAAEKKPKKEQE